MNTRYTTALLALCVGCGGDATPVTTNMLPPAGAQGPPAAVVAQDAGPADATPDATPGALADAMPDALADAMPDEDAPSGNGCYDPEGDEHDVVEVTFVGIWNEHSGFDPSGSATESFCPPAPQVGHRWGFGLPYDSCDDLWVRFSDEAGRCEFSESLTSCPGANFTAVFELQFDGGWEGPVDLEFADPGDFVEGRDWCRYTVRTAP
jgi:hypothetical protein